MTAQWNVSARQSIFTAHVFRHSYLTFLGTLNTNVKTIQAIAGHSDIQTTMNRYVHKDRQQIHLAGRAFSEKVSEFLSDTTAANVASNKE